MSHRYNAPHYEMLASTSSRMINPCVTRIVELRVASLMQSSAGELQARSGHLISKHGREFVVMAKTFQQMIALNCN